MVEFPVEAGFSVVLKVDLMYVPKVALDTMYRIMET